MGVQAAEAAERARAPTARPSARGARRAARRARAAAGSRRPRSAARRRGPGLRGVGRQAPDLDARQRPGGRRRATRCGRPIRADIAEPAENGCARVAERARRGDGVEDRALVAAGVGDDLASAPKTSRCPPRGETSCPTRRARRPPTRPRLRRARRACRGRSAGGPARRPHGPRSAARRPSRYPSEYVRVHMGDAAHRIAS